MSYSAEDAQRRRERMDHIEAHADAGGTGSPANLQELVAIVRALDAEHAATRDALFAAAAHLQGNSDASKMAAKVLGIPHPIRMTHLEAKAIAEGRDPKTLWPWYSSPRTAAGTR